MKESLLVSLLGAGLLAGCGGGPATVLPVSVSISPSATQSLDASSASNQQFKDFTATVVDDPSGKGVTWSNSGAGTLTPATPTSVRYNASTSPGKDTLTATSVADPSKSTAVMITVNPQPTVTVPAGCITPPCALPPATPNAPYSVSLPTVLNLSGGTSPFTWAVVSGKLPANLTLNQSTGVISGNPMIAKSGTFIARQAAIGSTSTFSVHATDSGSPQMTFPTSPMMLSITDQIGVSLSPDTPQTVVAGQTLSITATVTNDPQNAGVTWTATCAPSPCGSFSPTATPSGSPTTYTAPATVTATLAITVTATSGTDPTKSASLSVSVTLPPPIFVTLSPSTPQALADGQTLSITATVANDPTNGGVDWIATCSATACGTLNPASTASGAPTMYTPPAPVTANLTVTVTATSVADKTKSASLTVTVTPNNNAALSGDFAILFTGFDAAGEVAVVARFTADGNGGLKNGLLDYNTAGGSVSTTFTGTYTVDADNRGTLTASPGNPGTSAFFARFVLETKGSETRIGRIIEFDDSTGAGARGSGEIHRQDLSAANLTTLASDYAMGLSGDFGSATGRFGVVGRFTLGADGTFSAGQVDASVPGTSFSSPLTGKLNASDATTGRGTGTVTITVPSLPGPTPPPPAPTSLAMNIAYYIVSQNRVFVVVTDQRSATSPLLSGEVHRQQQTMFTAASLTGPVIFAVAGGCVTPTSSSPALASVTIGQLVADGNGKLTGGEFDQNDCGTINSNVPITAGAYAVDLMVKGRVTITLSSSAKSLMLYLQGNNKGYLLEGTATTPSSEVTFGIISPQVAPTGGFTEASLAGTYAVGTLGPATSGVPNESGVVALTSISGSPSTFSGTLDISQATTPFLVPNTPFAGTYVITAVPGRFTATATSMSPTPSSFVIYAIAPGGFGMIDVTPGNVASPILFFEQ